MTSDTVNMSLSSDKIPSPDEFNFAPADVRLKITYNDSLAYAHVSSGCMSHASPVWKMFLFPPWAEHKTKPVEELDFTEDDTPALLVLLHVAHMKTKDIKYLAPTQGQLVNFAIVCDKYGCADLLQPWIQSWASKTFSKRPLEVLRPDLKDPDNLLEVCQAMILVGWVFRERGSRDKLLTEGISWIYLNSKKFPEFAEEWPLPASIMKEIVAARENTFTVVARAIDDFLEINAEGFSKKCLFHGENCLGLAVDHHCMPHLNRFGLELEGNILAQDRNSIMVVDLYEYEDAVQEARHALYNCWGNYDDHLGKVAFLRIRAIVDVVKEELLETICSPSKFISRAKDSSTIDWKNWSDKWQVDN